MGDGGGLVVGEGGRAEKFGIGGMVRLWIRGTVVVVILSGCGLRDGESEGGRADGPARGAFGGGGDEEPGAIVEDCAGGLLLCLEMPFGGGSELLDVRISQ